MSTSATPGGPSPHRKQPRSIRTVLVWLVLACLLPGLLVAGALVVREYFNGLTQLEASSVGRARSLSQVVDRQLLSALTAAKTLASDTTLERGELENFHQHALALIAATDVASIIVLSDKNGQQRVNTLQKFGGPLPRHGNPDILRKVFATGQAQISDIYIGGVTRQPVMSIDVPVVVRGEVAYCLSFGLTPSYFNDILNSQELPRGWLVAVFDSTGTIAGRIPSPETFVGQKGTAEFIQRIQAEPEGTMQTVTREGIPSLSSWSRSKTTGWSAGIGIPRSELERNLMQTLGGLVAGLLTLLGISLGLAWFVGQRIANAIHALTQPAASLGMGKTAPVPSLDIREIADVADAIGHAGALLEARNAALESANQSLVARDAELKEAHQLARFGTWRWNLRTDAVTVSDSVPLIFGRDVPAFQAQRGTLLPVDTWETMQAILLDVARTGTEHAMELPINHGNGATLWISVSFEAVRNAAGVVTEVFGTLIDITKRKQAELALESSRKSHQRHLEQQVASRTAELMAANEELRRLARHDVLTGLQNRIAANERLRLEFLRMKRTGSAYSVLFMDIDHFKRINDTFGHETGDQVLRTLADILLGAVRGSDLVARFGGEEFLAILADTDTEGARLIGEKIRRVVSEASFPGTNRLTLSVGVSTARADDGNEEAVVRRADDALYAAKEAGRDAVRLG